MFQIILKLLTCLFRGDTSDSYPNNTSGFGASSSLPGFGYSAGGGYQGTTPPKYIQTPPKDSCPVKVAKANQVCLDRASEELTLALLLAGAIGVSDQGKFPAAIIALSAAHNYELEKKQCAVVAVEDSEDCP
jgi:hypothetical protein